MSRYLCNKFAGKEGYHLGEQLKNQNFIKLNANESPYPPSPKVMAAITKAHFDDQRLYADPHNTELVETIAQYCRVEKEQVLADGGSDVLLSYCLLAYGSEGNGFYFPDVTYNFYKTLCDTYSVIYREIPLKDDYSINIEDYCGCGHHVLLANPNAPSGLVLSPKDVERIVSTNPDHIVIIDEAYVDFDNETSIPLTKKYDNLIVIQTLSKSRSLAGARVGFVISSEEIISDLDTLKASFNPDSISNISQAAGCAAMKDIDYMKSCTHKIIQTRDSFARELKRRGFEVMESHTNFLFAKPLFMEAKAFYLEMKNRGVLIRHFDQPRTNDYVRITIGSQEQMEQVIERVDRILAEMKEEIVSDKQPLSCAAFG